MRSGRPTRTSPASSLGAPSPAPSSTRIRSSCLLRTSSRAPPRPPPPPRRSPPPRGSGPADLALARLLPRRGPVAPRGPRPPPPSARPHRRPPPRGSGLADLARLLPRRGSGKTLIIFRRPRQDFDQCCYISIKKLEKFIQNCSTKVNYQLLQCIR